MGDMWGRAIKKVCRRFLFVSACTACIACTRRVKSPLLELTCLRYDESPPKHQQYVDGAPRMVGSYFEKDRDLVEEAIRIVMT